MKRKIVFLAACLLLATALLAGCGNGGRDEFYAYLDGKVENSRLPWEKCSHISYFWDANGVQCSAITRNSMTDNEELRPEDYIEFKEDNIKISELSTKRGTRIGDSVEDVLQTYPEMEEAYLEGKSKSALYMNNSTDKKSEVKTLKYEINWIKYFIHGKEVTEEEYDDHRKSLLDETLDYECRQIGLVMENNKVTEIFLRISP